MSAPILKLHIDERDNISVRVSQDVQVLTCEEADRIEDEYKRMQADNESLRELVQDFDKCLTEVVRLAYIQGHATIYDGTLLDSLHPRMRELGVEVVDE